MSASHFLLTAAAFVALATPAFGQTAAADPDDAGTPDIVITARKLDAARDSIQPALGASEFKISRAQLDIQPGGADRSLKNVLLQAPGVTQDSDGDGDVHVRNEHGNLQYRLNGVIVPESISSFGQTIDARVANSVDLITGTLPAQYGYRTSGVVALTTRTDSFDFDGDIGVYGGSHGTIQPSATIRDSIGGLNYFASASYLQNDQGIENSVATRTAIHDRTRQYRAFAYISDILSDSSRITAFGGTAVGSFQIPNNPGQPAQFVLNGRATFDSATLDQNQREVTHYGVLAYQRTGDGLDFQVAPFLRYSRTHFTPDANGGDLILTGGADDARLSSLAFGIQGDASVKLGTAHILRFGLFFQNERTRSNIVSRVFRVDANGAQTSDQPVAVTLNDGKTGQLYGVYLQDEWTLLPTITVNYGVRFDIVRAYTDEQQVSPRANLVWKPANGTTFHLGYARNFTPPPQELIGATSVAQFDGTTRQAAVKTGGPVRAEREHYLDGGVQQQLTPGLSIGLDGYYKWKRNLLDEGQFGASLVQSPFNYERGYSWGIELRADYTYGPFSAYANLARGREKGRNIVSSQYFFDPAELATIASTYIFTDHSQEWTASGGSSITIKNHWGAIAASADFLYGDGLRTSDPAGAIPNGGKLPAYFTANFGIGQTFTGEGGDEHGLSVRFDVVNLFDRTYLLRDGAGVGVGAPQYGARRGFFVGVRKSF